MINLVKKSKDEKFVSPKRLIYWQMNRIAELSSNMSAYDSENLTKMKNEVLILESFLYPKLDGTYDTEKKKIMQEAANASGLGLFHCFRKLLNLLVKTIDENNLLYEESIYGQMDGESE